MRKYYFEGPSFFLQISITQDCDTQKPHQNHSLTALLYVKENLCIVQLILKFQ